MLDFTVLTSLGVRMSRALNASSLRPSNISGLGDTLESDLDDDDADQNTVLEVATRIGICRQNMNRITKGLISRPGM